MTRLTLSLCALAAVGMAGCTTYYDPPPVAVRTAPGSPVPAPSASSSAWKPGVGVIQTISLGAPRTQESAAAGGAAPTGPAGVGARRQTPAAGHRRGPT